MRRFASVLAAALAALSLSACAKNPRCTFDASKEMIAAEETVIAYVYEDGKSYEIASEKVLEMLDGEWTESEGKSGNKVLSFTVGLQYEVCVFDDGQAMIYSGLAGIFEKDRAYYTVKTEMTPSEMTALVREVGSETAEMEE